MGKFRGQWYKNDTVNPVAISYLYFTFNTHLKQRNRGIEISLMEPTIDSYDTLLVLDQIGIPAGLAKKLIHFHSVANSELKTTAENAMSFRNILDCGRLILEQLQRGISMESAVLQACEQIYIRPHGSRVGIPPLLRNAFKNVFGEGNT